MDVIPERLFKKMIFNKNQQTRKIMQNYLGVGVRVNLHLLLWDCANECLGSYELSLLVDVISSRISCADPLVFVA